MTTKMKTTTQTPVGLSHPAVMQCRHGNYDPRGLGWCHSGYCPSGEHVLYGSFRTQAEAQAYLRAHPELRRNRNASELLKGLLLLGALYLGLLALALIVVFGILMHIGS